MKGGTARLPRCIHTIDCRKRPFRDVLPVEQSLGCLLFTDQKMEGISEDDERAGIRDQEAADQSQPGEVA